MKKTIAIFLLCMISAPSFSIEKLGKAQIYSKCSTPNLNKVKSEVSIAYIAMTGRMPDCMGWDFWLESLDIHHNDQQLIDAAIPLVGYDALSVSVYIEKIWKNLTGDSISSELKSYFMKHNSTDKVKIALSLIDYARNKAPDEIKERVMLRSSFGICFVESVFDKDLDVSDTSAIGGFNENMPVTSCNEENLDNSDKYTSMLYYMIIGRIADPVGHDYWKTRVAFAGGNFFTAFFKGELNAFLAEPEIPYAFSSESNRDTYLSMVTNNVFGRNPTSGEKARVERTFSSTLSSDDRHNLLIYLMVNDPTKPVYFDAALDDLIVLAPNARAEDIYLAIGVYATTSMLNYWDSTGLTGYPLVSAMLSSLQPGGVATIDNASPEEIGRRIQRLSSIRISDGSSPTPSIKNEKNILKNQNKIFSCFRDLFGTSAAYATAPTYREWYQEIRSVNTNEAKSIVKQEILALATESGIGGTTSVAGSLGSTTAGEEVLSVGSTLVDLIRDKASAKIAASYLEGVQGRWACDIEYPGGSLTAPRVLTPFNFSSYSVYEPGKFAFNISGNKWYSITDPEGLGGSGSYVQFFSKKDGAVVVTDRFVWDSRFDAMTSNSNAMHFRLGHGTYETVHGELYFDYSSGFKITGAVDFYNSGVPTGNYLKITANGTNCVVVNPGNHILCFNPT